MIEQHERFAAKEVGKQWRNDTKQYNQTPTIIQTTPFESWYSSLCRQAMYRQV